MKKKIAILGSTGSIGKCLLNIISKDKKNFQIVLLSANTNHRLLFKQANKFKVKNLIITNKNIYNKIIKIQKKNKINIYNNFNDLNLIFDNKIYYTMNAIVGIDGLKPTLNIIKYTKNIAVANKESIISGWNLIRKKLLLHQTNFIPVDSEHFSIWSLLNSKNYKPLDVDKLYLTASGGPFYKKKLKSLKNVKIADALNHPTWKMGKKISIDSATMINKVFEIIEAKKIFNISYDKLNILIHPKSYVHSILKFKNGLINLVAHNTSMSIPIYNSLNMKPSYLSVTKINIDKLNNLAFAYPDVKNFPLIKLLKEIPTNDSLFETVIITINDYLVNLFLNNKIKFTDISKLMFKIINTNDLKRYKLIYPNNIKMILKTKKVTENFINKFLKLKNV